MLGYLLGVLALLGIGGFMLIEVREIPRSAAYNRDRSHVRIVSRPYDWSRHGW